jgi:hypothetical protein
MMITDMMPPSAARRGGAFLFSGFSPAFLRYLASFCPKDPPNIEHD